MFCFVALIIFGILGIFSAANRRLAKEAASCVFRHITLRPCNTIFRDRARGKILNWLLNKSPFLARIFNRYFEVLSWALFVLMAGSFGYSVYGGYNFYVYGSCNGPNSGAFCIFDPAGDNNRISKSNTKCFVRAPTTADLDFTQIDPQDFPQRANGADNNVIFIGSYACDHTGKAFSTIKNLLSKYHSNFTFAHFPTKSDTAYISNYDFCVYEESPEKFWQYNSALFSLDESHLADSKNIDVILDEIGLDAKKIKKCADSSGTENIAAKQQEQLDNAGIYGTPTIWINGKIFVGPKPERVYRRALVR